MSEAVVSTADGLYGPDGVPARTFLARHGFDRAAAERLGIGYDPGKGHLMLPLRSAAAFIERQHPASTPEPGAPVVIRNRPNNCLTRFPCSFCSGSTEKQSYLFEVDGGEIVCDHCAEYPQNIPVYARRAIEEIQERIGDLQYVASRRYVTAVLPVDAETRKAQGGMYSEECFAPWMRERLGLPSVPVERSDGGVTWITRETASPAGVAAQGPEHYHVLCVQDLGGTQECWRGWDEKRTRAEAEELARDAIEADRPNREGWNETTWEDNERKLQPKYGDDWTDLCSDNVAPGWQAIFIRPCAQTGECDIWRDDADRHTWEPWWMPNGGERDADRLAQETAEYIVSAGLGSSPGAIGGPAPTGIPEIKATLLSGRCWFSWMDDRVVAAMRALHGAEV